MPERVLISGAGIAGPTLAYWLDAAGRQTTLVERAPGLRSGGYVIDFWGAGYDTVERMRLGPDLESAGYHIRELRIVGDRGERVAGLRAKGLASLTGGRFITIPRSALSRLLFEKAAKRTEILFGEQVTALHDEGDGVRVEFERSAPRRFDLVIGADGLHSNIRRLAFGPERQFETDLNYAIAAFETQG